MMGAGCLIIFFGHFCCNQGGIQKSFITSSLIKTMSLLQIVVEGSYSVSCRDDDDDELPHIIVTAVHHFTRHHDIEAMVMLRRCTLPQVASLYEN